MNPALMDALIDLLGFLELSSDEVVNPDAAVQAMESASYTLQDLSSEDRRVFVAHLRQRADQQRKKGGPAEGIEFLTTLAKNLDLEQ